MGNLISNDRILFWETKNNGSVLLSPNISALKTKLRSNLLVGGTLLIRPAELVEGRLIFESATNEKGELKTLLDEGLATMIVPKGKSLVSHADWGILNPPDTKRTVSFDGKTWPKEKVPIEVRRTVEERVRVLEDAGWENNPLEYPESIYDNRGEKYKGVLKRLYPHFPINDMLRFAEDPHQPIENRGEIYAHAEKDWSKKLPSIEKKAFLTALQDELTKETILILSAGLESKVSWLKPQDWLRRKYGPLDSKQILFNRAVILGLKSLGEVLQKEQHPRLQGLLDMSDTYDFVKWYKENKNEISRDRHDLEKLLFGSTEHLSSSTNKMTLVAALINRENDALVSEDVAEQLIRARLNEYEEQVKRDALRKAILRIIISNGIGITLAFSSPAVGITVSLASALTEILQATKGQRAILASFRR